MSQRTLPPIYRDTALLGTVQKTYTKVSEVAKKSLLYAFLPIAVGNPFSQIPKVTHVFTTPSKAPEAVTLPITGSPLEAKIQASVVSEKATDEEVAEASKPQKIEPVITIPVVKRVEKTPEPAPEASTSAKTTEKTSPDEKQASDSATLKLADAIADQKQVDTDTNGLLEKTGENKATTEAKADGGQKKPEETADEPLSFIWPADGYVSQGFSYYHTGIDIPGPIGTPVTAAAHGIVSAVVKESYGYGWHIIVDHQQGYQTLYAHLSQMSVSVGQKVDQDQLIGLRGSTGRSTGSHLHFEVIKNGVKVNPLSFLKH